MPHINDNNKKIKQFLRSLSYSDKARIEATICLELEITIWALQQKLSGRTSFTKLEREKICEVTGKSHEFLFEDVHSPAHAPELNER